MKNSRKPHEMQGLREFLFERDVLLRPQDIE